ncbi:MAG TPA: GAF domain-containing sensor histidine kinase [Thermoanaerobaculia bacterium]|nr:GAF domain-containing sensor histidine kinase [Thermoanaerobaculia bacterium]
MIDLRKAPPELFANVLETNLQGIGPSRKLYGHFAEAVRLRLGAECAWLVGEDGEVLVVRGEAGLCDAPRTAAFLRDERLAASRSSVVARAVVHGRAVVAVGAARKGRDFGQGARRILDRLCGVLALELARREEARLTRVLDRIRSKIVSELRPIDLAYQILDGLHQLVDYDHSSAFLTWEPAAGVFRIEAEKISWMKGKSAFVGHELRVPLEMVEELEMAPGLRRLEGDGGGDPFWEMLSYHRGRAIPAPTSLLCAPLSFGGEFLGLLKIAAWKRRPFDSWDVAVVERFLPAAAVSIRNARVNMSLERQAIQAELKATLVTLANAVAHDVNNAVGTILPLVQQVREDLRRPDFDSQTLGQDLEVVVEKAQLCKRIFSNMLRVARAGRAGDGAVDVNQVVLDTVPFFQGQAERRGIETLLELAGGLPPVRFSRNDLQHIVLNLVTNSLEAMEEKGSRIVISTREEDGGALLAVEDDGPGIRDDLMEKVQEPFFSTKTGGTGLGLAICRALAWQNGGRLEIGSAPGEGTRVTMEMRLARDEAAVEMVV